MKDAHEITVCVHDRGTFFPVAKALARDVSKVLYHCPNGEAFETFATVCRGDGHPNIECVSDFWKRKKEIDLFVFPDCRDGGLQLELESQGYPVWGSKEAEDEEQLRGKWLRTCKRIGLPMPKTHEILGLTNLRLFFSQHPGEEYFVKISRLRGDMETWRALSPAQIDNKLSVLAMRFGPASEYVTFYVQEMVDTDIEGGSDTYFVKGEWPDKVIMGYEKKAEAYFAMWKDRSDMAPELWTANEKLTRLLAGYRYCNFVSTEIRVKDGESFLLDPCFRCPSPAGEEQLELYGNFAEIVWRGANGQMVQPVMESKYCGEAVIRYCGDREGWKTVTVPEPLLPWVKLYACACVDGSFHFPPAQDHDAIGCAVALGDTPSEVVDKLKDIAEGLKDEPVQVIMSPLVELFDEIEKAEEEGIPFGTHPLPKAEEVVAEK